LQGRSIRSWISKNSDILTEQETKFEEFQEWIEHRFNQTDTQSWSRIILFYAEDEADALKRFFDLFEEFLNSEQLAKIDETNNSEMYDELSVVGVNG
jgi:hypothetical protein